MLALDLDLNVCASGSDVGPDCLACGDCMMLLAGSSHAELRMSLPFTCCCRCFVQFSLKGGSLSLFVALCCCIGFGGESRLGVFPARTRFLLYNSSYR